GGRLGTIESIMAEADIVVASTGRNGLIRPEHVRPGQIVLALSNPEPEIEPEIALARGAAFALDGKAVNNLLAYPGVLRGALDAGATAVNNAMFIAAAQAIADFAARSDVMIPSPLDRTLHLEVTRAVARAAIESGVARNQLDQDYFESRSLKGDH
ncbi:MAG TPA: malic enzyme-like NAD(P)-binding protein, partial [Blastocatellia bacterium]|nr:malic enzyme-like NAD(P)-binding protein [Blastocatellia bacterium]